MSKRVAGDSTQIELQPHGWLTRKLFVHGARPVPLVQEPRFENCPWWSYVFFLFSFDIMRTGYARVLMFNDVPLCPEFLRIGKYYRTYKKYLEESSKRGKNYFEIWATLKVAKMYVLTLVLLSVLDGGITVVTTVIMYLLIDEVGRLNSGKTNCGPAVGYIVGLSLLQIVQSIVGQHRMSVSRLFAERLRQVLILEMNQKMFKMSQQDRLDFTVAKLMSLVTSDQRRLALFAIELDVLITAPIQLFGSMGVLIWLMGPIGLAGFAVVLLGIALALQSSSWMAKLRQLANPYQDKRISVTREALKNMTIMKFYQWEPSFIRAVHAARKKELLFIRLGEYVNALINQFVQVIPNLAGIMTFGIRVHMDSNAFTAARAFPALSAFQSFSSLMFSFSFAIKCAADAWVAIKRINSLFRYEDSAPGTEQIENLPVDVSLENCTFGWYTDSNDESSDSLHETSSSGKGPIGTTTSVETSQRDSIALVKNFTGSFAHGTMNLVLGSVGSGKTSFLQGISDVCVLLDGRLKQRAGLTRHSLLTYWNRSGRIRENICFGKEFDRQLYSKVIRICDLQSDLKQFSQHDLTEIGENGITLSGGQRARLALARCLYADGDIYVLDDVLSAMDAKVRLHIFKELVKLTRNEGKTIIMATNDTSMVHRADSIIYLNDGHGVQGKPEDMQHYFETLDHEKQSEKAGDEKSAAKKIEDDAQKVVDEENEMLKQELNTDADAGLLQPERSVLAPSLLSLAPEEMGEQDSVIPVFEAEKKHVGNVATAVFKNFLQLNTPWGIFLTSAILVLGAVSGAAFGVLQVFLNWWTTKRHEDQTHWGWFNQPQGWYVGFYSLIVVIEALSAFAISLDATYYVTGANTILFERAIAGIVHAPMSFFFSNPTGRILTRFSDNLTSIDSNLGDSFTRVYFDIMYSLASAITMFYYVPWGALCLIPVILVICVVLNFYRYGGRDSQRLSNLSLVRLYVVINETIEGCQIISDLHRESYSRESMIRQVDFFLGAILQYQGAYGWAGSYSSVSSVLISFVVLVLAVTGVFKLSPAEVGVLVNLMPSLCTNLTQVAVMYTFLEMNMNHVERLNEYAYELEDEFSSPMEDPSLNDWAPTEGSISFNNVSCRYRPELPLVMNGLTFNLTGGKKLAICGRTGAGKSTIVNALFRMLTVESGSICIDGQDIQKIPLVKERNALTTIPQAAVLFEGTIRSNLDPEGTKTDQELWDALYTATSRLSERSKERLTLDSEVTADGENFSLGERQMIALARALVRNTKILILDEATANVDEETDKEIQRLVRKNFRDRTVVAIAHRIKTILDYDEILVLGPGGYLLEKGSPRELFAQNGEFTSLVHESELQGYFK